MIATKPSGCIQIELVIEDQCIQKEIFGVVLTASITPVRAHPNGELDIDTSELLCKIQQSPASISGMWFIFSFLHYNDHGNHLGCVKLSFHDLVNVGYQWYFVKMNQPNIPLQDVPMSPDILTTPSSCKFKLLVEHVSHI